MNKSLFGPCEIASLVPLIDRFWVVANSQVNPNEGEARGGKQRCEREGLLFGKETDRLRFVLWVGKCVFGCWREIRFRKMRAQRTVYQNLCLLTKCFRLNNRSLRRGCCCGVDGTGISSYTSRTRMCLVRGIKEIIVVACRLVMFKRVCIDKYKTVAHCIVLIVIQWSSQYLGRSWPPCSVSMYTLILCA